MKQQIAEIIFEQLQGMMLDVDLRDDYSGRGMYGDQTHAISGDFGHGDVAEAIATAFELGYMDDVEFSASDFSYVSDNMGMGIVIY